MTSSGGIFRGGIILWAIRRRCRYGVSCRDLEEMPEERGVSVDRTAICRRAQVCAPEIESRLRWHCRPGGLSRSWRVDETHIKFKRNWACLCRAVDSRGGAVGFHLSRAGNAGAAKRFPGKAQRGCKEWQKPCVINTDKAGCCGQAIRELKKEGKRPSETDRRQVKHLNTVIEADHGRLKRLIRPAFGFKSMKTAQTTIKGFEAKRALRKKQASAFQLQPGIRGEVRPAEHALGIGPEMMSGLMPLHGAEVEQIAVQQGFQEWRRQTAHPANPATEPKQPLVARNYLTMDVATASPVYHINCAARLLGHLPGSGRCDPS